MKCTLSRLKNFNHYYELKEIFVQIVGGEKGKNNAAVFIYVVLAQFSFPAVQKVLDVLYF